MSSVSPFNLIGFKCRSIRQPTPAKEPQPSSLRNPGASVVRRSIATQQNTESLNETKSASEIAAPAPAPQKDDIEFENLPPELFKDEIYPMLDVSLVAHSAVTVQTTQLVKDVLDLLEDYTGFPVTDPSTGKIVGIVSMRDIFGKSEWAPIQDVMSTPAIVVCPETKIFVAAGLMLQHNVHRLPVVVANDPGTCVGIITRTDIFSHPISETEAEEILQKL